MTSTEPRCSYFIATNPRSGSWLLSSSLEDTGVAGHPSEWFNVSEEPIWCQRWNLEHPITDYRRYLEGVKKAGTKGGVFGAKVHGVMLKEVLNKLRAFPEHAAQTPHEMLGSYFPDLRYVRLIRQDVVRQAISYYRASVTNEWFSMKGQEPKSADQQVTPQYSAEGIARHEALLQQTEAYWDDYFKDLDAPLLEVTYEALVADKAATIGKVLAFLDVENADQVNIPEARFMKQADAMTEEWVARYQQDRPSLAG